MACWEAFRNGLNSLESFDQGERISNLRSLTSLPFTSTKSSEGRARSLSMGVMDFKCHPTILISRLVTCANRRLRSYDH